MNARPITINPVLNGFVVTVGCQTVVIDSIDRLSNEINRYYKNPEATEKDYQSKAVNRPDYPLPPAEPRSNRACDTSPGMGAMIGACAEAPAPRPDR